MKAWVFGGMLVLSAALAACSSSSTDGAGGGSGGGSGEGGNGDGGSGSATTGTNTGSTTNSTGATPTTTSTTTTTTGGNTCSLTNFFEETPGACDTCFLGACCAEAEACVADLEAGGTDCADPATGQFTDGPLADDVFACQEANCAAECGGGEGICDGPIAYTDEDLNTCIEGSCCTEHNTCWGADGENADACQACLQNGSGPECDGLLACAQEAGCFGFPVCDSNLALTDETAAQCLGDNCCDVTTACVGTTQEQFDECIGCLEDGGGAICDDLIACDTENACGLLTPEG